MNLIGIYVRVSSTSQRYDSQLGELERWVRNNGIDSDNVRWYIEKASGNNLERPEFEKLQADIFKGEIKTVVVWKLDRLSRSLRDGINVLATWCDNGLRVVSVTQQIDFNGTMGKMLAAVLLGIAELEQETRRERQRAGIDAAKRKSPEKYRGRKSGTTKAKPDRAVELRQRGLKDHEIATALGVSRTTVHRYFRQATSGKTVEEALTP